MGIASGKGYVTESENAKRGLREPSYRPRSRWPLGAGGSPGRRARLPLAPLAFLFLGWADPLEDSFEGARALSGADGKPVLLIFPAGRAADASSTLDDKAGLRRAQAKFHVARVRAADLPALLERFQVKRVPAVLLLDRHGGTWERWEPAIPTDLWAQVDRSSVRLKTLEEEVARSLAASRAALERKDYAGALAGARKVKARARPGSSEPDAASAVEADVLARAGEEIRRALAGEGITSDQEILADFKRLRGSFPQPEVQSLIDRETARIRSRPVGGSGKGEAGG